MTDTKELAKLGRDLAIKIVKETEGPYEARYVTLVLQDSLERATEISIRDHWEKGAMKIMEKTREKTKSRQEKLKKRK